MAKYTKQELLLLIADLSVKIADCRDDSICDIYARQWKLLKAYWEDNVAYDDAGEFKFDEAWFITAQRELVVRSLSAETDVSSWDDEKSYKAAMKTGKGMADASLEAYTLLNEIRELVLGDGPVNNNGAFRYFVE